MKMNISNTGSMTVPAPVTTGQVLVENIADTGANLVSCAER